MKRTEAEENCMYRHILLYAKLQTLCLGVLLFSFHSLSKYLSELKSLEKQLEGANTALVGMGRNYLPLSSPQRPSLHGYERPRKQSNSVQYLVRDAPFLL